MRIRTQFIITLILFGIVLVAVTALAVITNQQIEKDTAQKTLADSIAEGASELSYLSYDYVIYRETQQLNRWHASYATFSADVVGLDVTVPEQQALVHNIRANRVRLKEVFDNIVAAVESSSQSGSGDIDPAFLQVSWSRIAVQTQGLTSDADRLSDLLHAQLDRTQQTSANITFSILGAFILFFLLSYLIIERRVLRSIATVRAGTEIIGSGNLDFRIQKLPKDEIGDLSDAFNKMTSNLKEVITTKSELEREIIERKKIEASLKESEDKYRSLFTSMSEGFGLHEIIVDADGKPCDYRFLELNDAFEKLTGLSREKLIGRTVKEALPDIEPYWIETYGKVALTREPTQFENYSAPLARWYRTYAFSPTKNRFATVFSDITEQKRATEEVSRALKEWSATFDAIQDSISIHDKNFQVVRANRTFMSALGVDEQGCSGKACYELVHGTKEPWADCPHRKAMDESRPVTSEFFEPRLGKFLEVSCAPIIDADGELTGTVHIARDVTERKRIEETLEQAFIEAQTQRTEMSAIAEALRAIVEEPKFKDAALTVFSICKRITGATSGYVALLSDDGTRNEVLLLDSGGLPCTVDPSLPMPIRGLREKAYLTGKVVYDNNFGNSEWLKFMPPGHMLLANVLFSPLVVEGKAVGLIGLANKTGGFTERDSRIMKAMGELTSIGLKNSRSADALSSSEKRYRNLIETMNEGVWITRPSGEATFLNKRMAEMLGYAPEEMLGKNREEFTDPEYFELTAKMRAERAAGISGQYEIKLRHKNGSAVWALVSASPIYDEQGNHIANLGMHTDITERKRTEEQIIDLARFPEENPAIVMRVARDGTIMYANPACRPLLSNWECQAGGHVPPSVLQFIKDTVESGLDSDTDVTVGTQIFQLTFTFIAGRDYVNIYGKNVTVQRRAVEALLKARAQLEVRVRERTLTLQQTNEILQQEIAERELAEAELRTASLYARSLIEAALDPLVTISAEGKITDVNEATELVTGIPRDKLIGTDFSDYFTEPEKARDGYLQVFTSGSVRDYPLTIRHASGATTDVLYHATLYRNEAGEVQGVFAAARDITERKQMETELRRSNVELQQFAYITSHDMQEPLRMITSYLQLLEKRYGGKLDKDADEFIGYAVDGAVRMRNMINDLLEYSRIQTRGRDFEPVNVEHTFHTALSNLEVTIKENKGTVTHDPLPIVTADPTQFTQLLQNLIANGVKFHGETPPKVHISAKKEGSNWLFSVQDNGIGIAPEYQSRIFNIFQRLHTRDEYPGTGIGLALCKRIVERHGGRIWVESQAGQGATFYFTIPFNVM